LEKEQVSKANIRVLFDQDTVPMKNTPMRMSLEQYKIIEEHIALMLKHNIIEYSTSPWGARVVLAKKKNGK
jgi:hypothetical protein